MSDLSSLAQAKTKKLFRGYQVMFDPQIWSKLDGVSTHFPVALMLVSTLFDGVSHIGKNVELRVRFRFASTLTMVLGAFGSYVVVATGVMITKEGELWCHDALLRHHQLVWPVFALMTGLATWRLVFRGKPSRLSASVYLGLILVTATFIAVAGSQAASQ